MAYGAYDVKAISEYTLPSRQDAAQPNLRVAQPARQSGADVLVVDDSEMFCFLAGLACREAGCTQVEYCNTVDAALKIIEQRPPQACLLDVRLGTDVSTPVAAQLRAKGIPFAICSGGALPGEFSPFADHAPSMRKPLPFKDLAQAIKALVARTCDTKA